jgi:hypothetical protein
MRKKTRQTEELSSTIAHALSSADAKTLSGMQAILQDYAVLAELEHDEDRAIAARRAKLKAMHRPIGIPGSKKRRA